MIKQMSINRPFLIFSFNRTVVLIVGISVCIPINFISQNSVRIFQLYYIVGKFYNIYWILCLQGLLIYKTFQCMTGTLAIEILIRSTPLRELWSWEIAKLLLLQNLWPLPILFLRVAAKPKSKHLSKLRKKKKLWTDSIAYLCYCRIPHMELAFTEQWSGEVHLIKILLFWWLAVLWELFESITFPGKWLSLLIRPALHLNFVAFPLKLWILRLKPNE